MPRRKNPADARTVQICVAVKDADARMLRTQAKSAGLSLSRWSYCLMMASRPMPSRDTMALIGAIGRVGGLLNSIARIAHADGFSPERFADALALTRELQRLLLNVPR